MEESENSNNDEIAKNIISQAPNWNFSGDCLLLQWMERISQNLESRGKKTLESMDKLTKNVARAQISLENTQNSLNALQYTQYVEMRCQDDEVCSEPAENSKVEVEEKPKKDYLNMFMQNNLNMFHNCHERFDIPGDSDEDEVDNVASGENCIYQLRNPYNERLLPHIIGTKLWKENWHVGLCEDGTQNYSDDEQSDVYSLSSSSGAEIESIESQNTANLSQWTSSVSLNHEILNNSKSGSFPTQPITSTATSPMFNVPFPEVSHAREALQPYFQEDTTKCVEPLPSNTTPTHTENLEPPRSTGATKKIPIQSKTLNLFDDNDFKSLMSEISEKAQAKQNILHEPTERTQKDTTKVDLFASRSNSPIAKRNVIERTSVPRSTDTFTKINAAAVNLFDSPTDETPPSNYSTNSAVDLFADLDNDVPTFLSEPSKKFLPRIDQKTLITAKSLFDDDDGDDDFLTMFAKSNAVIRNEGNSFLNKPSSTLLFDNDDGNENDFFFSKNDTPRQENVGIAPKENAAKVKEPEFTSKNQPKQIQTKNLFMDDSDDSEFYSILRPKNLSQMNTNKTSISSSQETDSNIQRDDQIQNDSDNNDNINISRTDIVISAKPASTLQAFVDSEPPEDIKERSETQPPIVFAPKSIFENDDIVNLLSNKSQSKTASGHFEPTLLPSEKKLNSEVIENKVAEENPAMLGAKNFSSISVIDNTKTEKEDTSVPIVKTTGKDANSLANSFQTTPEQSSKEFENQSLEDAKNVESVKSADPNNEPLPKGSNPLENTSLSNELAVNVTKEESNTPLLLQTNEDTIQLGDNAEEPKSIKEESEKELQKPELNNPIQTYKPPTYDNYSPLFLDEPPDDDDFIQTISAVGVHFPQSNFESDFYEPITNNSNISNETKIENPSAQTTASYDIGLFCEFPPEDEETHNDDSPEPTLKQIDCKQPVLDEPLKLPTDVFKKLSEKPKDNQTTQNKLKSVIHKLEQPKEIKAKAAVTVSKLKMPIINVNVQALLPNAGGGGSKPKVGGTTAGSRRDQSLPVIEPTKSSQQILPTSNKQTLEEGGTNILPNLCKNRVRGPIKRRVSTRAGRQESYRRTLENEQDQTDKQQNKQSERAGHVKDVFSYAKNIESKIVGATSLPVIAAPQLSQPPKNPINNLFDFDDNEDNEDFFANIMKTNASKDMAIHSSANTTNDAEDSDNDLFKSISVKATVPTITKGTEPEISKQPSKSQSELIEISKTQINTQELATEEAVPKKLDTLFDSDSNDDDDDDDLFRSFIKPKAASKVPLKVSKEAKQKTKGLFSDSEDDDDDIFGSSAEKTNKVVSTKRLIAPVKKTTSNTNTLREKTKIAAPSKTDNPLADLLD